MVKSKDYYTEALTKDGEEKKGGSKMCSDKPRQIINNKKWAYLNYLVKNTSINRAEYRILNSVARWEVKSLMKGEGSSTSVTYSVRNMQIRKRL
jgi:hypothetical protein